MTPPFPSRARYLPPSAGMSGYRKLLAFATVVGCGTALQALDRFDETIAAFLGAALALYVGGNVREHAHRATATDLLPLLHSSRPAIDQAESPDTERSAVDREAMARILVDMMADAAGRRKGGGL